MSEEAVLRRVVRAGLIWPTLLGLIALSVLVGLGSWQLQRKAWKDSLIARIAERATASPIDFATLKRRMTLGGDVEYLRVRLAGQFRHEMEHYVYVPGQGGQGYNVYTPLVLDGGDVVVVNRGLVPDRLKDPARRLAGQVVGRVTVVGLVRKPGMAGVFTPQSDAKGRAFYFADMAGMAEGVVRSGLKPPVEVFVDAGAEPGNPGGWPRGGATRLDLPNKHFGYAITWFGLAATLIGVYWVFAVGRWRASGAADQD
jgi:surfeit locus 1 family protein